MLMTRKQPISLRNKHEKQSVLKFFINIFIFIHMKISTKIIITPNNLIYSSGVD